MPCPHLSRMNGDCSLQQDQDSLGDDEREPVLSEPVDRDWCLGAGERYRECPLFKRFIAELVS
ncbi:MAG: hypothetical protein ACE149_14215 [Armatimonadota bacterium]